MNNFLFLYLFALIFPLAPNHQWQLINDKHWQMISNDYEAPEITDAREGNRGICPAGMVEIKGNMKLDPNLNQWGGQTIEALQKTTCIKWLNREPPYRDRCKEYDRDKWLNISKDFKTKPMHFCIDRFEYPNRKNVYPWIYVNWYEAKEICESEGKRLPTEDEWTFACEGEEAIPYGYGYIRDETICVIDKMWRPYHPEHLRPRNAETTVIELDRLWQGEASGSRPKCKSPFSVFDMNSNVDELVSAVRPSRYKSILKGGYFSGAVRNRCRASTRSHNENFLFYQESFRCASNAE